MTKCTHILTNDIHVDTDVQSSISQTFINGFKGGDNTTMVCRHLIVLILCNFKVVFLKFICHRHQTSSAKTFMFSGCLSAAFVRSSDFVTTISHERLEQSKQNL